MTERRKGSSTQKECLQVIWSIQMGRCALAFKFTPEQPKDSMSPLLSHCHCATRACIPSAGDASIPNV